MAFTTAMPAGCSSGTSEMPETSAPDALPDDNFGGFDVYGAAPPDYVQLEGGVAVPGACSGNGLFRVLGGSDHGCN
jgi:hypothetical protein